jgi:hypothetical protein
VNRYLNRQGRQGRQEIHMMDLYFVFDTCCDGRNAIAIDFTFTGLGVLGVLGGSNQRI